MAIGDGKNEVFIVTPLIASTLQPPSGEEWLVRDIATDASGATYPQNVLLQYYDGTNTSNLRWNSADSWGRPLRMFVTTSQYLRVLAAVAGSITLAYSAIVTNVSGAAAGRGDAKVGMISLAANTTATIQPPSGESWSLQDVGSSVSVGDNNGQTVSDVVIKLTEGTYNDRVVLYRGQFNSWSRPWLAIATNAMYFTIASSTTAAAIVSYSAVRMS